ncbi:hypothetical protein BDW59DRAFT_162038 [Aspergillus cavernicola]|uniref:Lanthionine synthetase C family protein n=1 Tax=Aspergillus cavernicola TaxID=176166 RepID=A0ABR4IBU4_9EURO
MSERPSFYQNTLDLPQINPSTLQSTLEGLSKAVLNGVDIIEAGDPPSEQYDGRGIFSGGLGIALAYLRLAQQVPSLGKSSISAEAFYSLASARIPGFGPNLVLNIGGLSPLSSKSPIAAVVLRILHKAATGKAGTISEDDFTCLNHAVTLSLTHGPTAFYHGHNLGADEVLFGRAGLLWALLNIRARISEFPPTQQELLLPALERIPDILSVIIDSGRDGSAEYIKKNGEKDSLPLMWTWMQGHYGVGWAHGLAGIIPILLACQQEELTPPSTNYLPEIGQTITALCRICIAQNGHLPTSIPPRSSSSSRKSPLVQICHGAPAILGLLGCAMKCPNLSLNHWTPEWDDAARLATNRVWEEGLLSKGGSLCHGIAGNAWPLLLLHDVYEYNTDILTKARDNYATRTSASEVPNPNPTLTGDHFLSRALAMLLHSRETQPYNQSPETGSSGHEYRMPDHPYCFFEGLAGTVCAWAETCAVIQVRLRRLEGGEGGGGLGLQGDAVLQKCMEQQLGFPFLGGNGVPGVL